MKADRMASNTDKSSTIFVQKMRRLFVESGKTHGNLAEFIEQKTGESVTRQAIGQWCNGNTCPNLKTVPIIASFFGVSVEYLLTDTEVRTTEPDLKAVCNYTGLNENSVNNLRKVSNKGLNSNLLIEMPELMNLILYLSEIKRLTTQLDFYKSVVYPTIYEDGFYDELRLNGCMICETDCQSEYKGQWKCEECPGRKSDKDYIYNLLNKQFLNIFIGMNPSMDTWDNEYNDLIDLSEFKLNKALGAIIEKLKQSCYDDSSVFLVYYNRVRDGLKKELKELENIIRKQEEEGNKYPEFRKRAEAEATAIKTFLEMYDVYLNRKKRCKWAQCVNVAAATNFKYH